MNDMKPIDGAEYITLEDAKRLSLRHSRGGIGNQTKEEFA